MASPGSGSGVETRGTEPSIHFGFAPDPSRARALDRRMHTELGASLRHVCDAARGRIPFDEEGMERLVRSLEGGERHAPPVFAHYYELVRAILEQDAEGAADRFVKLAKAAPIPGGQTVGALEDAASSEKGALYTRFMTDDPASDLAFLPPSQEVAGDFADRYRRGMALMERAVPELAGEVGEIIREVVCVVGSEDGRRQFDGGSHFQLWGALFLNGKHHPTEHAIVEVVAHESAHSLLFGFCTEHPLVYNEGELFASPLRVDPRPMDGIYHATYVSARMHLALTRLLESGTLSTEVEGEVTEAREADRKNFWAGHGVVAEHGELSEVGEGLMNAALEYMASVAG